jgi:hypothetical protein
MAPASALKSASSLEQWILATRDIPRAKPHKNELYIIERIRQRYENDEVNPNAPYPRYGNVHVENDEGRKRGRESEEVVKEGDAKKRRVQWDQEQEGEKEDEEEVGSEASSVWSWPGDEKGEGV